MKKTVLLILLSVLAASISAKRNELAMLMKHPDVNVKYQGALNYYNNKDYKKALQLFEDIQGAFRGTDQAQDITYYLANCYVQRKDYESAIHYLELYTETYIRGKYLEECHYMLAYCHYKQSPHYELDQTSTVKAVTQLNYCLTMYPSNEKAADAKIMLDEMNDKLAKRELANAKLYYNLGMYMGNNYRAAVVTSMNAMNDFPDCQYKEDFAFIIVKAKYKETLNSVSKKMYERSEDAWDECYYFLNEFPNTTHRKEVEKMAAHLDKINKANIDNINNN
ncbi:MAG: outer membrane protein assembly factor BamD [Paludibacteraceae bacterium]|nr:outer membrane protein assembly factor BamD [Paludibacteraceae bacterium]